NAFIDLRKFITWLNVRAFPLSAFSQMPRAHHSNQESRRPCGLSASAKPRTRLRLALFNHVQTFRGRRSGHLPEAFIKSADIIESGLVGGIHNLPSLMKPLDGLMNTQLVPIAKGRDCEVGLNCRVKCA